MKDEKDFERVAKACAVAAIEFVAVQADCYFCNIAEDIENGGNGDHAEGCPLHGFDLSGDVDALEAWARK